MEDSRMHARAPDIPRRTAYTVYALICTAALAAAVSHLLLK